MNPGGITRREAIRRTVFFSSALLAPGWTHATPAPVAVPGEGLHFLAVGDFGTGDAVQRAVAGRMASFAKTLGAPLAAVLALGDNFYGALDTARFAPHFEEMYSRDGLDAPFYAVAGNHDYGPDYDSKQGPAKVQIEIDYARDNPASRWKMPAKWYAVEFPQGDAPLLRMIFLDGSYFPGALTPQEKLDQRHFLEAELARPTRAGWTWVVTHYPLFSDGPHGDNAPLIADWGPLIAAHPVALHIAGHDHTLQHLEVDGYPCSFVVSGGGGAHRHDLTRTDRGFTESGHGFNHLHVTREWMDVQFLDPDGNRLHAFRRTADGKVAML